MLSIIKPQALPTAQNLAYGVLVKHAYSFVADWTGKPKSSASEACY